MQLQRQAAAVSVAVAAAAAGAAAAALSEMQSPPSPLPGGGRRRRSGSDDGVKCQRPDQGAAGDHKIYALKLIKKYFSKIKIIIKYSRLQNMLNLKLHESFKIVVFKTVYDILCSLVLQTNVRNEKRYIEIVSLTQCNSARDASVRQQQTTAHAEAVQHHRPGNFNYP